MLLTRENLPVTKWNFDKHELTVRVYFLML